MNYFFEHLLKEFALPLQNPVLIFSLMLFIILLSPIVLRKGRNHSENWKRGWKHL